MNPESRTYKSLVNSGVALLFYVVTFFLSFIARRILIAQLGPDLLGLNTTTGSLLSFLNLAELGIGTAIAFTLYKPLQTKDIQTINEIVSLQGWFYKRVAGFIILGSIVLLFFFPAIFAKTGLPIWYAVASYVVLLFSSLLGYFVNYRQIVLSANQQQYKIQLTYGSINILKVIVQLIAVTVAPNHKYLWWLAVEVIFTILGSIFLNVQIKKTFPELNTRTTDGRMLKNKYPDILVKVKQLFIHKIGTVALNQTSPVIIYAYASLALVTSYGNYLVITRGISTALNAMFNSMNAGVGNLIAEGNKNRIMSVFRELFSSRFLIISTCCYSIYMLSAPFISLWVGEEYMLGRITVLLIVILFYIMTTREVVDSFINGYGLFQDIWAPAVEAALNIGSSILLGHFWGLPGILLGVLISQVTIIMIWKPILLFWKGFNSPLIEYVLMYGKHLVLFAVAMVFVYFIVRQIPIDPGASFYSFAAAGLITELLALIILGILLYIFERGMRDFVQRMIHVFA